ncbi:hypothetical protein V5O48_014499 [Marasmius crinis-equi]|uniref:SET domain-containing protein n=1 Tax=Marasmius crinis-equi TaxID=585013 RepID=A0ABR3EX40_9AGAR
MVSISYASVFKDASRLNHSCRPNVGRILNPKTFGLEVCTACPVKKGDEPFIHYHDIEPIAAERPEELALWIPVPIPDLLRRMFYVKPSPERPRKRLVVWLIAMGPPSPESGRDVVQPYLGQLRLLEEEGLKMSVWYGTTLSALEMVCCMMGNADEAFECEYSTLALSRLWTEILIKHLRC